MAAAFTLSIDDSKPISIASPTPFLNKAITVGDGECALIAI